MRVFASMIVSAIVTLGGCSAREISTTRFRISGNHMLFPVVIPTPDRGTDAIYCDPLFGIETLEVTTDGRPLEGQLDARTSPSVDLATTRVASEFFVYQLELERYIDLPAARETGSFELLVTTSVSRNDWNYKVFRIDEDVKVIVIRYRPRYASGAVGPIVVARFIRG